MKKMMSAILVALTFALPACMAEPMDAAEIEAELNAEARGISIDDDDAMRLETNDAVGCSSQYRSLIAQYYWTTKPLCNTQPVVDCSIERISDPQTPCRLAVCANYVYYCNPNWNL